MPHHHEEQSTPRDAGKKNDTNTAVWFFVAAVFIALSPTLGEAMNISVTKELGWSAAGLLAVIGFWLMFRRR